MRRLTQGRGAASAAILALLGIAACGGDTTLAPQFEPEIVNLQDSFEFQATDITGITQTLSYDWQNSGVSANIDQSSSVSAGNASILIRDSQGTTVFQGDLAVGGTFQSSEGTAGVWNIRVALVGASGTLNFRAEKRTP